MRKRLHLFYWLLIAAIVGVPLVFAAYSDFSVIRLTATVDDSYLINARNSSSSTVFSVDTSGNVVGTSKRYMSLPLAAAFIDGTGVIGNDGTTAPGIAEHDNVPAIVYASSGETTAIQYTFRLPDDYSNGLVFKMLISAGEASGANHSIDWSLWENVDGTVFDAAAMAQTAVTSDETALNTKNDVLTFTANATALAAYAAGDWVTVDFFNAGTSDTTTEIKGIDVYYTPSKL